MKPQIQMSEFKQFIIKRALDEITTASGTDKIIVLRGIPNEITRQIDPLRIADIATFSLEKNSEVFSREWFADIFIKLTQKNNYTVISNFQFHNILSHIDAQFFKERVLIISDNLRIVFPLESQFFIQGIKEEAAELRSDLLPIHHIEQFKIGETCYFISKHYSEAFDTFNIFDGRLKLNTDYEIESQLEVIDINNDEYALDLFINSLIEREFSSSTVGFNISSKSPDYANVISRLELLNTALNVIGIEGVAVDEGEVLEEFTPSAALTDLLKIHWGNDAVFRHISVYKNPQYSTETIEISQGRIVQLIIDEYKNARQGNDYRDLLLTAPTGAGKSLLFQLPAFEISKAGDVVIVVSPLIALMQDQVSAIVRQRGFNKVAYLNSTLSLIERERVIEDCKNGQYDILYMSPELLLSYDIGFFIGERKLGLIVVDEAHLITTWGRDFRVDYWFLGNHIRKIRVHNGQAFPMVAVTATAIFGGNNDMVFDTETSLAMKRPHRFIGSVKRSNIEFLINNYTRFEKNYDDQKLNQTVDFVNALTIQTAFKILVYAPYASQVSKIEGGLLRQGNTSATKYYGQLDKDTKNLAYKEFLEGERQVMISTKAFGMGVDIPDIQVVYHHAPSGSLPDYVQEVGRLARITGLKGYATLNYSKQDKWYMKALHGMSALKPYQLQEVLKKISSIYEVKKTQNLLVSVDDFVHIFEPDSSLDQKVLTSLMMIEKDYLSRYRFNVLIARPKKLFVKAFARVQNEQIVQLLSHFGSSIEIIPYGPLESKGYTIITLNLDKIWEDHYSSESFPKLKHKFYKGELFNRIADSLVPQLRIKYSVNGSKADVLARLTSYLTRLTRAFEDMGDGYFSEDHFRAKISKHFPEESLALKISGFILSNYAGRLLPHNMVEENAFMGRRLQGEEYKYRLVSTLYNREFNNVISKASTILDGSSFETERFITNKESNTLIYIRIGNLIDLFDLGNFEIKGGDNPMIFIRVNDPKRIAKDGAGYYNNALLNKTLDRHYMSNRIFDHFFTRQFTNEQRWDFIENFFLGKDVDELIESFPGQSEVKEFDIVEFLASQENPVKFEGAKRDASEVLKFPPIKGQHYNDKSLLTICEQGTDRTLTIAKWINQNPILLHQTIETHSMMLAKDVFKILVSRLRDGEYWRDFRGLEIFIKFPKYPKDVRAIVPYKDYPVEFYKWWHENKDKVRMSLEERIRLIRKVSELAPKAIKKDDHRYL